MSRISMKQLLEAGVQFGHQTRRWNPKMKPYIYTERNGIYIVDLQQTVPMIDVACDFLRSVAEEGKGILFIGTKKQAQESVTREAKRCGAHYITQRWLGGTMTNFKTINKRIERLHKLEEMELDGTFDVLPKKEVLDLKHERDRLEKFLGGIKYMEELPGAVFIVDPKKEKIALMEAKKLDIPVVAIVDTNCDPDDIDYIIPGNDDAIRAVALISKAVADAILEVKQGESFDTDEDNDPQDNADAVNKNENVEPEKAEEEAPAVSVEKE